MTGPRPTATFVERELDLERDLPALAELIAAGNTVDDIEWIPTAASLASEWAASPSFDPRRDTRLIADGDRIVGAANHHWRERDGKIAHRLEVWVHPDVRRRGLGGRLLDWAETHARSAVELGLAGSPDVPHVISGIAGAHVPAGVAFATARGYVPVRHTFGMRRPLDTPLPDAALPAGIDVRPVEPSMHRRIWDADVEAFQDHWEAAVRHEEDFVEFIDHPDVDTSLWQVAWDGDEVAGSVINGIYQDENARLGLELGWLDHVSVRRQWRGCGLASALIARSLRVLRDRGMTGAALGVDAENPTGALGLYERLGFTVHRTFTNYRRPL